MCANFIKAFRSTDRDYNFLHYLKNNGSYRQLVEAIIREEKTDAQFNLSNFLTRDSQTPNKIYEIPTDELCHVLNTIFTRLGVKTIHEVGAGMGLLSARLHDINHSLNIIASDKHENIFGIQHQSLTYCPVANIAFEDITDETVDAIIISWLYSTFVDAFVDMITRCKTPLIIHVGEHDASCYTEDFIPRMKELGYHVYILQIKQLSKVDYFERDLIRKKFPNSTRTCTTVFSKTPIDFLDNPQSSIGSEYFGNLLVISQHTGYYVQDICVSLNIDPITYMMMSMLGKRL